MITLLKRLLTPRSTTQGRRVFNLWHARFGVGLWSFDDLSPRMRGEWDSFAADLRKVVEP